MVNKVRFGIIGSGTIVQRFLEAGAQNPYFVATAHYSRSLEKSRLFTQQHGIELAFDSLEAMADSGAIDAVYIASPNVLHARQANVFLDRGIAVLCEKAITTNALELQALLEKAQAKKVLVMEAMRTTVGPNFQALRAALGRIGTIRRYSASYCQYSSRYDDFRRGIIHNAFDPAMGGGALMDIGVYALYPLVALFGKPHAVMAQATLLNNGIDGQGSIICNYPGMLGVLQYSKISNSSQTTEIQGEEGTIRIDAVNLLSKIELIDRKGNVELLSQPVPLNDMVYEIGEFIACLQNGQHASQLNSPTLSLSVMEVLDAARAMVQINQR